MVEFCQIYDLVELCGFKFNFTEVLQKKRGSVKFRNFLTAQNLIKTLKLKAL